jgi:uncharacterized membrane protein YagU involved in acid resistance
MAERAPSTGSMLVTGVIAGAVGGILFSAYFVLVALAITHSVDFIRPSQFDASAVVGKVAFTDPRYALLGIAVHFTLSIAWAVGYAYAAVQTPQVRAQPIVSGIVYGIIVYVAMLLVQVAAGVFVPPNTVMLVESLIAHTVFFGLPVAFITRARLA